MSDIPTYPQRHAITKDEYLRMGSAGVFSTDVRLELMEGEIIEIAPIGSAHAAVVNYLAETLNRICGNDVIVSVQSPIVMNDRSVPQPDIALLRMTNDRYFCQHPTAADVLLAIEVADTALRFDLERKAALYAASGIAESWVVDIERRGVHVLREPRSNAYSRATFAGELDVIDVVALPRVSINVATIFPKLS